MKAKKDKVTRWQGDKVKKAGSASACRERSSPLPEATPVTDPYSHLVIHVHDILGSITDNDQSECRRAFDEYWARRPAMMTIGELWHAAWRAGRKTGGEEAEALRW